MLDFTGKTKIVDSKEFPLVSGASISAEGMALINYLDNGVERVKPCNGADAGVFVGFSYGYTLTPLQKAKVAKFTVPAVSPYTATLTDTPISGQIAIVNASGTEQTVGDPSADADTYSLNGTVLTFHAGQAGKVVTVTYKYSPTALELTFEDKVMNTSFAPSEVTNSIGCILKGEVYTDQFDASAAWTASSTVKLGSNGVLTDAGGGATVSCTIIHIPTVDCPLLGLRF
jgi:hypothetical protein